jgi:tetratricopeptide (TPR) repeat protein
MTKDESGPGGIVNVTNVPRVFFISGKWRKKVVKMVPEVVMPPKNDDPMKNMSKEDAKQELERFFKRLEEDFKETPKELMEVGSQRVIDFIKGNITWAEMFNIPKKVVKDMVEYGYLQFQSGRYEEAERFFKMLTVMDWNNSYYHSMMGSILQRQKRYGEAVAEYSEAVRLNPNDIVSRTNRGEVYMLHKVFDKAVADFEKAASLDPKKEDKWANRARALRMKIEQIKKVTAPKEEEKGKGKKKGKR